jgi:hypothetical protein
MDPRSDYLCSIREDKAFDQNLTVSLLTYNNDDDENDDEEEEDEEDDGEYNEDDGEYQDSEEEEIDDYDNIWETERKKRSLHKYGIKRSSKKRKNDSLDDQEPRKRPNRFMIETSDIVEVNHFPKYQYSLYDTYKVCRHGIKPNVLVHLTKTWRIAKDGKGVEWQVNPIVKDGLKTRTRSDTNDQFWFELESNLNKC